MQPIRIWRTFILALLVLPPADCRDRGGSVTTSTPPEAPGTPAAPYLLVPSETAAYRRGREREIVLLREALTRHQSFSPLASITAGAAAAGLPVNGYRLLVARVDSGLRLRSALAPEDSSGPGRAEWAELDSLRVELTVLRTRLDARGNGTP
jgi:hypothetical protein